MEREVEQKQKLTTYQVGGRLEKQTLGAGTCARGLVQVKLVGGVKAAAGTLDSHLHIGDDMAIALSLTASHRKIQEYAGYSRNLADNQLLCDGGIDILLLHCAGVLHELATLSVLDQWVGKPMYMVDGMEETAQEALKLLQWVSGHMCMYQPP
jgi:hypothetical protein